MNPANRVYLLRSILAERESQQTQRDAIDLVWTGDEILGASGRDTRVVVQELFHTAQRSVLISTYAILQRRGYANDKGENAASLFGGLAAKMDKDFKLQVRLFLNIKREFKDTTPTAILVREYARRFRAESWPGKRIPDILYDPRSLEIGGRTRACLHAKCVVIKEEYFGELYRSCTRSEY
jgi:hypothetical protein